MVSLNVVFPVGKKPSIVFHESTLADKDCYIYWDMDYLKLQPLWLPKEDIMHKEVYSINGMQARIDQLKQENEKLKEFVQDCSVSHNETRYKYRAQVLLREIE